MSYESAVVQASTNLHTIFLSKAAVVGAAALIILRRDGYARETYFAYGDDGIGVWRSTQSSSFLRKSNEPSLDDDRQPRTAPLGLFGEGAPSVIDDAAKDTHLCRIRQGVAWLSRRHVRTSQTCCTLSVCCG